MIEIENLRVNYGSKEILRGLNLCLESKKITAILGKNGSGKTTLLRALLGLVDYKGAIKYDGLNFAQLKSKERAKICSYVPQSSALAFEFSALEMVLMGRYARSASLAHSALDISVAHAAMEKMGILELAKRPFMLLSGGQKQMVLIARALAQESSYILLDEPVTGLDFGNTERLLELLSSIDARVIFTTHNIEHALKIADSVLVLKDGKVYAHGDSSIITEQMIYDIYGICAKRTTLPNGATYFYKA